MNPDPDLQIPSSTCFPAVAAHRSAILSLLSANETPLFIGERENLVDRFRALETSLRAHWHRHVIGYSFKTNYLVAETGIFAELGGWAEVVSGREYRLARQLGFAGDQIIFNGPYKTDDDIRQAIADGALINVNDLDELERLLVLAKGRREPVGIGLRVSATLPRLGHSRFGFSLENGEAVAALARIERESHVTCTALHMHLYADTDDAALYRAAVDAIGGFLQENVPNYQHRLDWINLGGGFPAHIIKPKSRDRWAPQPIDVYIQAVTSALRAYFPEGGPQPTLVVEPGRYLTSDGILFVSRVVHVKQRAGLQAVNSNASISMLPLTHYCPQMVRGYTAELVERHEETVPSILYGATCRENDILYQGEFPRLQVGDYLIHYGVGAYNSSLSPDFIFASPPLKLL